MKKDWIRALLNDAIGQHKPVSLLRKKLGVAPLLCIPLLVGEGLALVSPYEDFLPDGYEVVRLRDVSRLEEDGSVAFHGRIMEGEGLLSQVVPPADVPLGSFEELLSWLMLRGEPVIVTGKNDAYLLGNIEKVGKSKLGVRYIDGEGRIDTRLTRIPYEDIISVCFATRYLRLVVQYATPPGEVEAEVESEEVD